MESGAYTFNYYFYAADEDDFFELGMRILQMVTYASYYYEEMSGEDAEDVTVIFPSNIGTYYNNILNTISISGEEFTNPTFTEGYESWDVVMHEYGHHVLDEEGWSDSPRGHHSEYTDMAEHYKSHYDNNTVTCEIGCALSLSGVLDETFSEIKCKYKGMALAWSEGCATFFSIASQLYCQEIWFETASNGSYTHGIRTFGNTTIDYGSRHQPISYLSSSKPAVDGQNAECFVHSILFSIYYHPTEEQPDNLDLGHRAMWEIMEVKKAKTIYEFVDYFVSHYPKEDVSKLGQILHINYHATSAPTIKENNVIEFHFDWEDLNSAGYFNARKFQINFYDDQYNLITSTEPDTAPLNFLYISTSLWSSIINNRDSVYVSITTYEYDGNINNTSAGGYYITQYESALTEFTNPSIATEVYYNTQPNIDLGNGECEWFKFTAPHTTTYTFSTLGNDDVYVELFGFTVPNESQSGLLNQINTDNFEITINYDTVVLDLKEGETVYIRIREANYGSLTDASLRIEHECTYNTMYAKYSATQHKATCFCGNTRYESHSFVTYLSNIKCQNCGYITSGPGAIVKPFSSESGIDSADYVCYYVDEEKKH
jgi:hypothetical protein